jgi:hypothetical protein
MHLIDRSAVGKSGKVLSAYASKPGTCPWGSTDLIDNPSCDRAAKNQGQLLTHCAVSKITPARIP